MSNYGVDSFHINVGAGDAAIHLLLELNKDGKPKHTIAKTIIVDGGKSKAGEINPNITKTIEGITTRYIPPKKDKLIFDAVVVSHWDADHFEGIVTMLQEDVDEQLKKKKIENVRISFFNDDTIFYAPYWYKRPPQFEPKGNRRDKNLTSNDDSLECPTELKVKASSGGTTGKVCKLRVGTENLLGQNLFNPKKGFTTNQLKKMKTPIDLLAANPPIHGNIGLYCIGVNTVVLGEGFAVQTTPSNKSSIITVMIDNSKTNAPKITHYFAGDADYATELRALEWTKADGNTNTVTSMKLSHHGAVTSTPLGMLDNFKPKNIIISAGEGGYGHPRWEILIYIQKWAMTQLNKGQAMSKPLYTTQYPIYLMKIAPEKKGEEPKFIKKGIISIKELNSSKDKPSKYQKALMEMEKLINKHRKKKDQEAGFLEEAEEKAEDDPKFYANDGLNFIKSKLVRAWENMCHMTGLADSALSGGFRNANNLQVEASEKVAYIKVLSRAAGAWDNGIVYIKYNSSGDEETYGPVPVKPLPIKDNKKDSLSNRKSHPSPRRKMPSGRKKLHVQKPVTIPDPDYYPDSGEDSDYELDNDVSDAEMQDCMEPIVSIDSFPGYYFSSDIPPDVKPDDPVEVLAKDTPFHSFVDALHRGVLILEKNPHQSETVPLLEIDEWRCWMFEVLPAVELLAIVQDPSAAGQPRPFPEFRLSLNIGNQILSFGTGFAKDAFDYSNDILDQFRSEEDALVFGLDPQSYTTLTPMTLHDVANLMGMKDSAVVRALGNPQLKLVPSANSLGPKPRKSRNALWFSPYEQYETVLRLQFECIELNKLASWLKMAVPGFEILSSSIIAKTTSTWVMMADGNGAASDNTITLVARCSIEQIHFQCVVAWKESSIRLTLQTDDKDADVLKSILDWLAGAHGIKGLDLSDWLKMAQEDGCIQTPRLRRLILTIKLDDKGNPSSIMDISLSLELCLKFGKPENDEVNSVVFLFTFGWTEAQGGYLNGTLWCAPPATAILPYRWALPDWEDYLVFEPITTDPDKLCSCLDLKKLLPGGTVDNIPKGIPTQIIQSEIEINSSGMSFSGAILCQQEDNDSTVPQISLGKVELAARYSWASEKKSLMLQLGAEIELRPGKDSPFKGIAFLRGLVKYDSGRWTFRAHLQNLYIAHLYSFFDTKSRDGVMSMVEKILIEHLDLEYTYGATEGGAATSFKFTGAVSLGALRLAFLFKNEGGGWFFNAGLGAGEIEDPDGGKHQATTVGQILKSIANGVDLPSAVADIKVGKNALAVSCRKVEEDGKHSVFFTASAHVEALSFTFAQYRSLEWGPKVPPKRFIKASVSEIPHLILPLIGDIAGPFDEMFYLWVQDNTSSNSDKGPGLTKAEFEKINGWLGNTDQLHFKATKPTVNDDDVVLEAGSHFFVVAKNTSGQRVVLVDYVFGKKTAAAPKDPPKSLSSYGINKNAVILASKPGSGSSKAAYKKSAGSFSIENIGFSYENETFSILMDASILLGPISLSLLGFSIDIKFDKAKDGAPYSFHNLPPVENFGFSLSGLAVSFDRPPLTIGGIFKHIKMKGLDGYAGGIVVTFQPWAFKAAGFYGKASDTNHPEEEAFTTAFMFAKLDGPLFSLGWADISGLTGGFGYNSGLTLPTVGEMSKFPLLSGDNPGDTTADTMKTLLDTAWFALAKGHFWLAAGLKVKAFQMLSVEAVVVVRWNPDITLAILGRAVCDVPSTASKFKFAHVELNILCDIDFHAGVLKTEAQLSPYSYILDPSCHLTGGFALYYWFKDGPGQTNGDWVFTIGGYHQAFKVPIHYPNPPRLGISWSLDSHLSITGEAYFAVTPKVCMGGGRLHAALSLGPLSAFFDAFVDWLINYKPFFFTATGKISVGVRYTLDLWLVTIPIAVEVGAMLHIKGPPVSGSVHVDFWVFGFDVNFGPGASIAERISLHEFYNVILQSANPAAALLPSHTSADDDLPHVLSCTGGMMPEDSSGSQKVPAGAPWKVRGGDFSFLVSFRFAVGKADYKVEDGSLIPIPLPEKSDEIYAKPMQLKDKIKSETTVSFSQKAEDIILYRSDEEEPTERHWTATPISKPVPSALWGKYDEQKDPIKGNGLSDLLDGTKDATIPLIMGLSFMPPKPKPSPDLIKKFNVIEAMKETVFKQCHEPIFPPPVKSSPDWQPSKPTGDASQWKKVVDTWRSPKLDTEKAIGRWGKALGWDTGMTYKKPKYLLDHFDELVMAPPVIAARS